MLMLLRYDSPADLEKEIEMSFQKCSPLAWSKR